jgi:hypothetical protein
MNRDYLFWLSIVCCAMLMGIIIYGLVFLVTSR